MALRCPVCKADNAAGPNCRRCKADLALLFTLEQQRREAIAQCRLALREGRLREAATHASTADHLHRDEESQQLVALTALLCRDYHRAWRVFQGARGKREA